MRGASPVYLITLPLVMGRSDTLQIRGADGSVLWAEEPPHPVEPDTVQVVPVPETAPENLPGNMPETAPGEHAGQRRRGAFVRGCPRVR